MAKILFAEDEPDIRELIAFTLRFAGHETVAARDGAEALQAAQQGNMDLILLDVRMPHLTGYEVCERIKADERLQKIPVVFLSAKGQESEINAGYQAGAQDYILKPFSPDQLILRVQQILGNGQK
jgi:CheY-like chemotaxis protein